MNESKVKVNIIRNWSEAKAFYFLAFITVLSFISYIFFTGQTVFRLVSEKNMESQKRNLISEISELELQTLALNDTISIEKAYELGFVTPKYTKYVASDSQVSLR